MRYESNSNRFAIFAIYHPVRQKFNFHFLLPCSTGSERGQRNVVRLQITGGELSISWPNCFEKTAGSGCWKQLDPGLFDY